MRYLRLYEDLDKDSKEMFKLSDIEYGFANSFDLCTSHEITTAYFDPEDYTDWASNDFSNGTSILECAEGVMIDFNFRIGHGTSGFSKYTKIVSEVNDDINRFIEMFKYNVIIFDIITDNTIRIVIG